MPKLSKDKQKSVGAAESSGFDLIPAGRVVATLKAVVADKDGNPLVGKKSGMPYWRWEFGDCTAISPMEGTADGGPASKQNPVIKYDAGHVFNGQQFVNTSLSDDADWKMKEVFDAFGYSVDSDTDEMIGHQVVLHITRRPIEGGDRDGEMGNNVGRVAPYVEGEDDDWDGE